MRIGLVVDSACDLPLAYLREHDIEVFESVMSLTGMVNVGKGAVVVGFAAEGTPRFA